jgi:hypothetical protein
MSVMPEGASDRRVPSAADWVLAAMSLIGALGVVPTAIAVGLSQRGSRFDYDPGFGPAGVAIAGIVVVLLGVVSGIAAARGGSPGASIMGTVGLVGIGGLCVVGFMLGGFVATYGDPL